MWRKRGEPGRREQVPLASKQGTEVGTDEPPTTLAPLPPPAPPPCHSTPAHSSATGHLCAASANCKALLALDCTLCCLPSFPHQHPILRKRPWKCPPTTALPWQEHPPLEDLVRYPPTALPRPLLHPYRLLLLPSGRLGAHPLPQASPTLHTLHPPFSSPSYTTLHPCSTSTSSLPPILDILEHPAQPSPRLERRPSRLRKLQSGKPIRSAGTRRSSSGWA